MGAKDHWHGGEHLSGHRHIWCLNGCLAAEHGFEPFRQEWDNE